MSVEVVKILADAIRLRVVLNSDSELTNTQIVVKQFEELRPNSVIEVADVMTFDLARLKDYVGKLAEEQINELDKLLETIK